MHRLEDLLPAAVEIAVRLERVFGKENWAPTFRSRPLGIRRT